MLELRRPLSFTLPSPIIPSPVTGNQVNFSDMTALDRFEGKLVFACRWLMYRGFAVALSTVQGLDLYCFFNIFRCDRTPREPVWKVIHFCQ